MKQAVASLMDDIPMAKGRPTNAKEFAYEILSPNRLKMGRNNSRSLHMGISLKDQTLPSDLLERGRKTMELYYKLMLERVFELTMGPDKWKGKKVTQPKVDDIVLFVLTDGATGKEWKLGRVTQVEDRKVTIIHFGSQKEGGIQSMKISTRSFRDIAVIVQEDEVPLNSNEYLEMLKEVIKV